VIVWISSDKDKTVLGGEGRVGRLEGKQEKGEEFPQPCANIFFL